MAKQPKKTSIEKRRRLSALYEHGAEVRFSEDGVVDSPRVKGKHLTREQWVERNPEEDVPDLLWPDEDDVVVWVQPPDPLQREEAIRAGQAAKARTQIAMRDPESQVGLEAELNVGDLTEDALRQFLVDSATRDVRSRAVRDVLAQEEWEDFTALQDSMREWEEAGYPETDEWQPLIKRDREYGEQIQKRVEEIVEDTRTSLKMVPVEELKRRAKKKYGETLGDKAFMETYEINMLYFACRDDEDRRVLFFEKPEEIKTHPEFVQLALARELGSFIVDPKEAKNSRRVVPGSEQLEPPVAPETSEASTPEELIA